MKLINLIATTGILLALAFSQAQAAPAASEAGTVADSPGAASAAPSIKSIDKHFLLSRSSPVYQRPDNTSEVIAHVKKRRHIHVIGITGDWLQVKLPGDKVGFIPTRAAE
jgi:hypothetical protein